MTVSQTGQTGSRPVRFGYFLSCEEYTPAQLVEQAVAAQEAGFEALCISDHFHPWNDNQGQSAFVWSVIGALSQACSLPVQTAVTCPTVRIHPAGRCAGHDMEPSMTQHAVPLPSRRGSAVRRSRLIP